MGKTADGAVWLNAEQLSAYEYWQYWRNTEDADVGRFLKLFTTLPIDEISKLEALGGAEINEAKKTLATEATALIHSRDEAEKAEATARETFEQGGTSADLPTVEISKSDLEQGIGLLGAYVTAGLAGSNGEARRHIKGGGARLNDQPVTDERYTLSLADVQDNDRIKLSVGKKRHVLLAPV